MIHFVKGDILKSDAEFLVVPVDCIGMMNRGLALRFRKKYPNTFHRYQEACQSKDISKKLYVGKILPIIERDKNIICFPVKTEPKFPPRLGYIEDGMKKLIQFMLVFHVKSIALPRLAYGGKYGLRWSDVKDAMLRHFAKIPEEVEIYIYQGGGK